MNSIFLEVTSAQLCIQLMLLEQFQNQPQMFYMFFVILWINKNAIKEKKNKLVQVPVENIIPKEYKHS